MKKLIICIGIYCICCITYTFSHDCNIVIGGEKEAQVNDYITNKTTYHTIIPPEAFDRVLTNLKAYCCKNNIIECSLEEKNMLPEKTYPNSAYLFDHLIDITLRRLDGVPSLAYGLEVDPMAKIWRESINKIAADHTGMPAINIQQEYEKYWKLNKKTTNNINRVLENYDTTETNTLSMADKYEHVCEINKILYTEIQNITKIQLGSYRETKSFYRKCVNITRERVQRETQYVKLLMIQKSNQMMETTTKAYTRTYFVEERLMGLWNLISRVKDMFQIIVKQAPVSKSCN